MSRCSIPTDPRFVGSTEQESPSVLDRLPIEDQVVLLLVDLEGFDYGETSDILGIPVEHVIATLGRTRALFEKHLTRTLSSTYGLGIPKNIESKRRSDIRKLLKAAVDSIPLPANMEAIIIARIQSELLHRPANPGFLRSQSERLAEKYLLLLVMLLFNVMDPVSLSI